MVSYKCAHGDTGVLHGLYCNSAIHLEICLHMEVIPYDMLLCIGLCHCHPRLVVDAGASVDSVTRAGHTALHTAAIYGRSKPLYYNFFYLITLP